MEATAQPMQNLETYKNLRQRLKSDFMLAGEGKGMSLVAERRDGSDYPNKLIFHADETSNMGYYLSTLATEYRLLSLNGKPTGNTLQELGYALKAINRLDETAESYLRNPSNPGAPQQGDLNGFFIRSDVSHQFFSSNSTHFNSGNFGSTSVNGITSSFYDETLQNVQPLKESQDQVLNLLMGLSFVSKFVHASIPGFQFQDGLMDFSAEAKAIASRMIGYLKQNGWKIKDPVSGQFLTNAQGGEAHYLSYGFAEAVCGIQNEFTGSASGMPEKRCITYHDAVTTNYYPFFQYMQNYLECPQGMSTSSTNCRNCHELYKPMMLAAIGSSYYQNGVDVTSQILYQQGVNTEIQIIPLIHKILWQPAGPSVNDTNYTRLLDMALPQGPYNHGYCDYPEFEWSAPVRWRQPERRGAGCEATEQDTACYNFFSGDYNGLDYMLLFNLYCLSNPSYVNYDLDAPLKVHDIVEFNPSVTILDHILTISSSEKIQQITIYDLKGKIILDIAPTEEKILIPLQNTAPGLYLMKLSSTQHSVTRKFVIH